MTVIGNILGEVCKSLFPINEEVFQGNSKSSICICTLSSIQLLKDISNSNLMNKINLVGRLLSENKGIESILRYVNSNSNIKTIIICGKDVSGHKSGSSLLALYNYGINSKGRIINSTSPEPFLEISQEEVNKFQSKVRIINKIGETNLEKITKLVESLEN